MVLYFHAIVFFSISPIFSLLLYVLSQKQTAVGIVTLLRKASLASLAEDLKHKVCVTNCLVVRMLYMSPNFFHNLSFILVLTQTGMTSYRCVYTFIYKNKKVLCRNSTLIAPPAANHDHTKGLRPP